MVIWIGIGRKPLRLRGDIMKKRPIYRKRTPTYKKIQDTISDKRGIKVDNIPDIMERMSKTELNRRCSKITRDMIEQKHIPWDEISYQRLTIKISPSGCVSLYGISKMPLNLYVNQWIKIYHVIDDVINFIMINDNYLAKKKS